MHLFPCLTGKLNKTTGKLYISHDRRHQFFFRRTTTAGATKIFRGSDQPHILLANTSEEAGGRRGIFLVSKDSSALAADYTTVRRILIAHQELLIILSIPCISGSKVIARPKYRSKIPAAEASTILAELPTSKKEGRLLIIVEPGEDACGV